MNQLKNFINNKEGLAYILAMFFLSIVLDVAVYFPLSYVWDHLYAYITSGYTFTGDTLYGLEAIQLIISYLLAIGLIFTVNYMFVNAKAQQYD
jgi:accessory gene regulator protein AgrB